MNNALCPLMTSAEVMSPSCTRHTHFWWELHIGLDSRSWRTLCGGGPHVKLSFTWTRASDLDPSGSNPGMYNFMFMFTSLNSIA